MIYRVAILILLVPLFGCQTLVPIALRCDPPPIVVSRCVPADSSAISEVLNSTDPNVREQRLTAYAAFAKRQFDDCAAKHQALVELNDRCNQIVERTAEAVKSRR